MQYRCRSWVGRVSMNKRREKLSDLRRLADCYLHFARRDPEMQRGPDWPQDDPHWHLAKALEPVLEFVNGIANPEERAILALNACSIIADETYDLFAAEHWPKKRKRREVAGAARDDEPRAAARFAG